MIKILAFFGALMLVMILLVFGVAIYYILTDELPFATYEGTNADMVRDFNNRELAEFLAKIAVEEKLPLTESEYIKKFYNWLKDKE